MIRVTVLGCGSSGGVPLVGCDCPVCASANPKNRRLRASIAVERAGTRILVDTGPDLREQLFASRIKRVDAVVYTHCHADHVHGIDEVRSLNYHGGGPIKAYADAAAFADLERRFGYAFEGTRAKDGYWYAPGLLKRVVSGPFRVKDMDVRPFPQRHGANREDTLGLRIGPFAYSTDVKEMPEEGFAALAGTKVWIVDCLSMAENPAHSHLEQTLAWIRRVKPERAILTHMNHSLDYDALLRVLPEGVEPAYDGMVIEVPEG